MFLFAVEDTLFTWTSWFKHSYTVDITGSPKVIEQIKSPLYLPVKEHYSADEVESEEHGQAECDVNGYPFRADDAAMIGQFGRPKEVVLARDRMHGADEQLEADLAHPLPRHGDPPIVRAVVNQE